MSRPDIIKKLKEKNPELSKSDLESVIDIFSQSIETALKDNQNIVYREINHNDKVSKVSIVGAGMVSTPGVTYRMFRALADEKINILAISTSEIKISVLIDKKFTEEAVKALHSVYKLS